MIGSAAEMGWVRLGSGSWWLLVLLWARVCLGLRCGSAQGVVARGFGELISVRNTVGRYER